MAPASVFFTTRKDIPLNNIVESNSNPLANAALGYADRGWRIIPLHTIDDGGCVLVKAPAVPALPSIP